jgi:DNA-damage-inducible protein J
VNGVSTSDAIAMFLWQVVMRQGMPFDVAVPNARTRRAIEELENPAKRAKLKRRATTDHMFADVLDKRGNQAKSCLRWPATLRAVLNISI